LLEACEHYLENLRRIPENTITLTARELEVLSLTAEGLRRNEIAVRLVISPGTVKMHLENIYRKLGADGKTAAIKKAQKLKIL
jgi:LuxR family maltose regulon positive regulatory protein